MTDNFHKLKDFWFIVLFVGGLVVQWTAFSYRLSVVETRVRDQDPIFLQIQKDIVEIKTTLSLIQLELKR